MKYEITCFRGAPWTFKLLWALSVLPKEAVLDQITFTNVGSADSLKGRVAKAEPFKPEYAAKTTVSLPMLFYKPEGHTKEVVIRESAEILEFFCNLVQENSEFARSFTSKRQEIMNFNDRSDKVFRYLRAYAVDKPEDNLVQYFVPTPLNKISILTSTINNKVLRNLKKKYYDIGISVPVGDMEGLFQELEDYLSANPGSYLLGAEVGFSYADVVIATMVEAMFPKQIDPPVLTAAFFLKALKHEIELGWNVKYPNLLAFRDRIFAQHLSALSIKITKMKITQKLKVVPETLWNKK